MIDLSVARRLNVRTGMVFAVATLTIMSASAGSSVGTASSSSSFEIRGHLLNVGSVPSWPILAGDDVCAMGSSVELTMRDGSRITLAPNSRVQIESTADGLSANLISGSMRFSLTSGANLRVLENRHPVPGRSGSVASGGTSNPTSPRPELTKLPPPLSPLSGR